MQSADTSPSSETQHPQEDRQLSARSQHRTQPDRHLQLHRNPILHQHVRTVGTNHKLSSLAGLQHCCRSSHILGNNQR